MSSFLCPFFNACRERQVAETVTRGQFVKGLKTSHDAEAASGVGVLQDTYDKEITFTFGNSGDRTEWAYDEDMITEWCGTARGVSRGDSADFVNSGPCIPARRTNSDHGNPFPRHQVRCHSRDLLDPSSGGREPDRTPVSLVVFDFDETLTLATFLPDDPRCASEIGWMPEADAYWGTADFIRYNFESPWLEGSRVAKLQRLFRELLARDLGDGGRRKTLAVLTGNEAGAVAVLNLLLQAGLASFFSAIWPMPKRDGRAPGVGCFQEDGQWRIFTPPHVAAEGRKADVLEHVVAHTAAWFPQFGRATFRDRGELLRLRPQAVVLVDDDGANFGGEAGPPGVPRVLRCCKVARYNGNYRDCGALEQMGGIGARSDEDYGALLAFLQRPWAFGPRGAEARGYVPEEHTSAADRLHSERYKAGFTGDVPFERARQAGA